MSHVKCFEIYSCHVEHSLVPIFLSICKILFVEKYQKLHQQKKSHKVPEETTTKFEICRKLEGSLEEIGKKIEEN